MNQMQLLIAAKKVKRKRNDLVFTEHLYDQQAAASWPKRLVRLVILQMMRMNLPVL